ncbi:hypothetical protein CY35_04G055100 [Sphagnum magellanicum]|nr:hypothetical protein CY35_04G055100 [Sphagnum magellanicum]
MAFFWTSPWVIVTAAMIFILQGGSSSPATTAAQSCQTIVSNRRFQTCQQLPQLQATLAWTFYDQNNTIDFAFSDSMINPRGWVGWGINPVTLAMEGTQALIAFQGEYAPTLQTYNLTAATLQGVPLTPGRIELNFTGMSAEMTGADMTIFATLHLRPNQSLELNHVWNQGHSIDIGTLVPGAHAMTGGNLLSASSINMTTGISTIIELPHQKLKNVHGIINAVSWGLLLPLGVMAARYLRRFSGANPWWFYIHVTCQCLGYLLGVVGWALGIKLENYNKSAVHYKHRNLGIAIFTLATLQVLAIILRPKKDHKVRKIWNVYHHAVGYSTIILIIINIFEGIEILSPGNGWQTAYISVIVVLGSSSIGLEILTWGLWLKHHHHHEPGSKSLEEGLASNGQESQTTTHGK